MGDISKELQFLVRDVFYLVILDRQFLLLRLYKLVFIIQFLVFVLDTEIHVHDISQQRDNE